MKEYFGYVLYEKVDFFRAVIKNIINTTTGEEVNIIIF